MLTAIGNLLCVVNRMNGTKKFPHTLAKVKIVMTAMPGIINGATIVLNDPTQVAPSTHAACSRSTGTPSMKPFMSHIPNGSDVAVRNRITAG